MYLLMIGLLLLSVVFFVFLPSYYKKKIMRFFSTYFIILVILMLVTAIIIFPDESVEAAYDGLITWASIVLPALLPFFIGSQLLIGLGVVKFIGVLLEPIMRPLFKVPGEGSFAFAMSITSGYPVGAKIVSKLRGERILSQVEAQRLIAFCSTSGPLFMIGAVSVGMFQSSEIGVLIALSHYTAAILVGFLFRFYKPTHSPKQGNPHNKNILKRALQQLRESRKENPSFGILMGAAVKESFNTMLMVGGFIIIFSVIINILNILGIIDFLSTIFYHLLSPLNMNRSLIQAMITGLFEITIGCKLAAETYGLTVLSKVAVAAFIIAWSGFSIHAQAISIISTTDINASIYMLSKLVHGILSFALVYVFYPLFQNIIGLSSPVFNSYTTLALSRRILINLQLSIELFIAVIIGLLFISLFISLCLSIQERFTKKR